MNDRLNSTRQIECLCGRWIMLVVDDRGPDRVFHWAPDDARGSFYACRCGRVYRALDNEPWIEESPLREGLTYRVIPTSRDEPSINNLQFIGIIQGGRAQFRGEDSDYIFQAHEIRVLLPGQ